MKDYEMLKLAILKLLGGSSWYQSTGDICFRVNNCNTKVRSVVEVCDKDGTSKSRFGTSKYLRVLKKMEKEGLVLRSKRMHYDGYRWSKNKDASE